MANNNLVFLEKGVFLPAEEYDETKCIPHLKELVEATKRVNLLEPGEIDEVDNCFLFFKRDGNKTFTTPLSFQYKLKMGNGEWIAIRDKRKFVVDAALEAFSETQKDDLPDYQKAFDLSVSRPARYEKYLKEGEKSYEFFVLGFFYEKDEAILKRIGFEQKKEEARPKVRKPPMKKVERNNAIQAAMSGNLPIALMSPTDVAAETNAQNDEVFPETNSSESSIFAEEAHTESEPTITANIIAADAPVANAAAENADKPSRKRGGAKPVVEKEVQSA